MTRRSWCGSDQVLDAQVANPVARLKLRKVREEKRDGDRDREMGKRGRD